MVVYCVHSMRNMDKEKENNTSKKSRCWIDSLEVDLKTSYTEPNNGLFLGELDPMTRCGFLGLHDRACKRVKYENFMRGYKQAEASQADVDRFSQLIGVNHKKHKDQALEDKAIVKINEPHILRMTMYEKLMINFEHFYNDQDLLSISSLILYPLCDQNVIRTTKFWDRLPWDSKDNIPQLSPCRRMTTNGSEAIIGSYQSVFEKLPDSLIVFHSCMVENHGGLTIFRAPYSYFFKMPAAVLAHSTLNNQERSVWRPPVRNDTIDIELKGCIELRFTANNLISEVRENVTYVRNNYDGNFTVPLDMLCKFLGYE